MERVRALTGHLLATPTSAEAASGHQSSTQRADEKPRVGAASRGLSADEVARIIAVATEYRRGVDSLLADGTLPSMSVWDVQAASRHELSLPSDADIGRMLDGALKHKVLGVLELLPGPWREATTREARIALCREAALASLAGSDVFLYSRWQLQYGDRGLSSNIAFPVVQVQGVGSKSVVRVVPRVLLADPADAARISQVHVRKENNFEAPFYDSIISTIDNEHWRQQRQHLAEAFMPLSSLAKILPVSLSRAKLCAQRLSQAAAGGAAVDMSSFLLHEAQAQLQLALLGAPEEFMEATNADIRATFAGDLPPDRVGTLGRAMKDLLERIREEREFALPTDGCPVHGPLSRALQTSGQPASTNYGNMLLVLFAGHDTTGHTMTWLLFELARNCEVQRKVHAEVDAFFASLGGRDPTYTDLSRGLELLDRCVTETLRLWPAVAAGTYRQLHFPETVRGARGADVELPRGTRVQIVNWSRHRNPELWGPDADEFNPFRSFQASEMARVGCPMAAMAPQSERFSPFAHAPRSCLGRNFAQMEMRLIMLHLLQRFEFSLAPPYDALVGAKTRAAPAAGEFRGVNRGTMGPLDLERSTEHTWGRRELYAMRMRVKPRS